MAKKLKVGDAIRGYRVTKVFGPGAMAISYAAQCCSTRRIKAFRSSSESVRRSVRRREMKFS